MYKVEDNILYWRNGAGDWLVKETCASNADALALKTELENRG